MIHRTRALTSAVAILLIAGALLVPPACGQEPDSPAERYLRALLEFEAYAESVWKDDPRIPGAGYFGDGKSAGNGGIRGTCGIALAYAVLVDANPGAAENPRRLARIAATLRFASGTHLSGPPDFVAADGKKWGRSWQSGLWAGSLGLAAFLVRAELPPALVEDCQAVLADEADQRSGEPPASGKSGNTRAEENGWNSNTPALAAAWLENHPHRQRWLKTAQSYLANTYSVAADRNGPMAKWVTTVNLYPSYMLENHGFYHPAYHMVSGMSMGDSYLMAKLVDPAVAEKLRPFAEHNVLRVWEELQRMVLQNGELAFPSGMDWALHSYGQVGYYPYLSTHFRDGRAATAEAELSQRLLERQAVNGGGRFIGDSLENAFYSEAVRARRISMAWLHHKADAFRSIPCEPLADTVLEHYEDVRVIVHRTPESWVSISYGSVVMMLVLPTPGTTAETGYVVAPQGGSLIGATPLGQAKSARLLDYHPADRGFDADLVVATKQGDVCFHVSSQPGVVVVLQSPRPAASAGSTDSACLRVSVENHPLTGGVRHVRTAADELALAWKSGRSVEIEPSWCSVSERLGVIYGPAGSARYECASRYNRKGAAVDLLGYRPARPLDPCFVILLPEPQAGATERVHSSVEWTSRKGSAKLEFCAPGGERRVVRVRPPPR